MNPIEFTAFPKMARLSRECVVTEKIDGTNAQIFITEGSSDTPGIISAWHDQESSTDLVMLAGSRKRWITPNQDNHGFGLWVFQNEKDLRKLGKGRHFGEWWGQGIQRGYGLKEKRFSLFNVIRWCSHNAEPCEIPTGDPRITRTQENLPECCHLVPELYRGEFDLARISHELDFLHDFGSLAAPGFMRPEGVIVFHIAGNVGFKKTIENDSTPKSLQ